jgi:phosphoribosylglycinamide formyltransferase-1
MKNKQVTKLAVLASGSGTNAENIVRYFKKNDKIAVLFILSNKADAYVHERAKNLNIPSFTISKSGFENGEVLALMQKYDIDWIILAGFLLKIPENLLKSYPDHIVNIHPALLPKYGGKGMYGMRVHEAVIANKEQYSGITIHYVNQNYDEGKILLQEKCPVLPDDTAENLAQRVHELEYIHYPKVIEQLLQKI